MTKRLNGSSICSYEIPFGFVVAGHIKKRSECTDAERLDVAHVASIVAYDKYGASSPVTINVSVA